MEIACAGFPLDSHFGPPIGCYPPGTGDGEKKRNHVGRGRFSWRLTVPTPFVPLGHFPLTGGIGFGRRRGRARRVVAPHANDHCYLSCRAPEGRRVRDAALHGRPVGKQREVALPPIRCTPPKIAHSHTFIGNYAPPCPFSTPSPHTGNRISSLSAFPTAKGHFFLDLSGFVRYNNKIARTNPK